MEQLSHATISDFIANKRRVVVIERLEHQAHLHAGPAQDPLQKRDRRLSPPTLDRRNRRLRNTAGNTKFTLGQARPGPRLPHQRTSRRPKFHAEMILHYRSRNITSRIGGLVNGEIGDLFAWRPGLALVMNHGRTKA